MLYNVIDETSPGCATSALNLFQTPGTNVAINSSKYQVVLPSNSISSFSFQFKISPSDGMLDLSKTYLKTKFKLEKKHEDSYLPIRATDGVSVIQALGACYLRNVRLMLNEKETWNANGLYAYHAITNIELNESSDAKATYLQACGYYSNKDGDSTDINNAGFIARKAQFLGDGTVEFISKLYIPLFSNNLYMLNNVTVDLELTPHDQNFTLIVKDTSTYRLSIESCKLYVKHMFLMDALNLQLEARLANEVARYGVFRTELKNLVITKGRGEYSGVLFHNQVPRRLILSFVNYNNFNSTVNSSPFIFEPFSISNIQIQTGGLDFPNIKYDLSFTGYNFTEAYYHMFENLNFVHSTESNGITFDDFKRDRCFFVFTLTNSQEVSNGHCFELLKSATTSVTINFKTPVVPDNGIAMLITGEFDQLITADKQRSFTSDATL